MFKDKKHLLLLGILLIITPVQLFGQFASGIASHPHVASHIRLLDHWIQRQVDNRKIPGMVIGIIYDGNSIYHKGFGYADIEKNIPFTPHSRYRIGSQTKNFTTIGIMILREEGKLALEDPIQNHLPWLSLKPFNETDPPITIHQLLTHSSGMSAELYDPYINFRFPSKEEFKNLASENLSLVYPPNTKWKYSNNAYVLLGEIIEAVSGQSFADFISQKILQPLDMTSTRISHDESDKSALIANYGRKMPDGSRRKFEYIDAAAFAASGGMSSNLSDLTKFLSWKMRLLGRGNKEIIKASSLMEMQRTQFIDGDWRWGLGTSIFRNGDVELVGKSGQLAGYESNSVLDPESKTGIIIGVNANCGVAFHGNLWSITDLAAEWLIPVLKIASSDKPDTYSHSDQKYLDLEGIYSNIYADSYVCFLDGKLQILNLDSPNPKEGTMILDPISEDHFRIITDLPYTPVGEKLIFKRDDQGTVTGYEMGEGRFWSKKIK